MSLSDWSLVQEGDVRAPSISGSAFSTFPPRILESTLFAQVHPIDMEGDMEIGWRRCRITFQIPRTSTFDVWSLYQKKCIYICSIAVLNNFQHSSAHIEQPNLEIDLEPNLKFFKPYTYINHVIGY